MHKSLAWLMALRARGTQLWGLGWPWGNRAGLPLTAGTGSENPLKGFSSCSLLTFLWVGSVLVFANLPVGHHWLLTSFSVWSHLEASFYVEMDLAASNTTEILFMPFLTPFEFSVCHEL